MSIQQSVAKMLLFWTQGIRRHCDPDSITMALETNQEGMQVHGGSEINMLCVKYMPEAEAVTFVRDTDEVELGRSLMVHDDHEDEIVSEITSRFDESTGSHRVEVKFYADVEDIEQLEAWCAAEGFEVIEKTFGSHV